MHVDLYLMTHTKKKADSAEDVEIPKNNNKSLISSNHHTIRYDVTPKGFIFLRFFCATNLPFLSRLDNTDVFMLFIHQAYVDTTRNLAWNNSCNQCLGQPSVTAGLNKKD